MKKLICLLSMTMLVSGCVTIESRNEMRRLEKSKKSYQFNLAGTTITGNLLIHVIPPSQQFVIDQYGVKIDDEDVIPIMKYSDAVFVLDEGIHRVEVFALPRIWKGIYRDFFGKPTVKQISITRGVTIAFQYMGPYWMWAEGKLEEVSK